MACTRSVRFELRRNTYIQWIHSTIILLPGEPGVETDTGQIKIGDGVHLWSDLKYVGCYPCNSGNGGQSLPEGGTIGEVLTKLSSSDYDAGWRGLNSLEELIRNIGLNAYINNIIIGYTYNPITNVLLYEITFFGNSSYYDLAFSYSPSLTVNSNITSSSIDHFFNNSSNLSNGQPHYTVSRPFTLIAPSAGTYNVTLNVTTANAGGIGNGSLLTITFPIIITPSDSMGNPGIAIYPLLNIVGQNNVTVSGIRYYGVGSYVRILTDAMQVSNMFNIVDNQSFNYVTFSGSAVATVAANTLTYKTGLVSRAFANKTQNINYDNGSPITLTITNTTAIAARLENAIGKTANISQFFPSSNTGQGSLTLIGYVGLMPNETNIPFNNTISAVILQTRLSISSAEKTPQTPSLSNIIPFNSNTLTTWDPAYNPLDGKFYASELASSLNSTYVLPAPATFTPGTKYLLLKLNTNAVITLFTLYLGSAATNVWVYWGSKNGPSESYGWYDASINWKLDGGCQDASSVDNKTWQIQLNLNAQYLYANPDFVYVNIEFADKIEMSKISVQ